MDHPFWTWALLRSSPLFVGFDFNSNIYEFLKISKKYLASLNLESMETEFGGRKADSEYESSQVTNGRSSLSDSAFFLRRFVTEVGFSLKNDFFKVFIILICNTPLRFFYILSLFIIF